MAAEKLSPGMQQYLDIKKDYPDAFLLFRMGDFYELFYEDAVNAAQILEISLTSRNKNAENPIPMAGVPYHSAQQYIDVLIEKGFPHHGAVAFGHYGKALFEVFKYIGVPVEEIGYNQPAGVRYPTENPWG